MNGESEAAPQAAASQDDGSGYERSSISFPYYDLETCLALVEAISRNAGASDCTDDQIAAWIDLSPKSSGFRSRMTAARLFDLIEQGQDHGSRLSDLGLKTVDPHHALGATVTAFLNVPLFKRVFENWRGQQVPPAAALERAMLEFGVANKQTARARQTLERSATVAGFYEQGRDRLVQPGLKPNNKPETPPPGGGGNRSGSGGNGPPTIDPIIGGLIARLPASGAEWPMSERKLWLQILESSFELVYKDALKQLPSRVERATVVTEPTLHPEEEEPAV